MCSFDKSLSLRIKRASFCLGKCQQGVAVRIDDEIVTGVNPENAEEIFREKVMKELQ